MDKAYLLEGLLRWNYFPNQKAKVEELPPIFSTRQLTADVAEKISKLELRKDGYDQVEYLATRYNNVSRALSIPHPLPYIKLVHSICQNWDSLKYILENPRSLIKPEMHPDGRVIIMDYEESSEKAERTLKSAFGKKFKVHTDITNCFPSIYTHAIPWALVGQPEAKTNKNDKSKWYNNLDFFQRAMKRQETQGVAIGPATSNIFSEVILARIDEKLPSKYSYVRYIDDYTCYCNTFEEAQTFLRELNDALRSFKLSLNIKKTQIIELPAPIEADWIVELSSRIPSGMPNPQSGSGKFYNEIEALRFLDFAVRLNSKDSDGSVLKFAVKSIIYHLHESAVRPVLEYLLNLARHYPLLLPTINHLLSHAANNPARYGAHLNSILLENALNRRSDGMAWPIYYLNRFQLSIEAESIDEVLKSRDCVAITVLYFSGKADNEVIEFVRTLDVIDPFEQDRYWLLRYQLYFDGKLTDLGEDKQCFEILKSAGVSFAPASNYQTASEIALVAADFDSIPEKI